MKIALATGSVALLTIFSTIPAGAQYQTVNWNGAYTGFEVGYAWGAVKQFSSSVGGSLTNTRDQEGEAVGGYLGYNWTFGRRWLVGTEGNLDWTDIGVSDTAANAPNTINHNWEGSLRGRLGFLATPSFLLYATGGYSFIGGSLKISNSPTEIRSATFNGWTVGLGSEWALDSRMALRVQYRFSDYETQRVSFPVHRYDISATPSINAVTIAITYRL